MKPSELLAEARKLIESEEEHCICFAANRVVEQNPESANARNIVCRHIESLLEGHPTYSLWLINKFPNEFNALLSFAGGSRKGRLAWIDDMIREFQKVGK